MIVQFFLSKRFRSNRNKRFHICEPSFVICASVTPLSVRVCPEKQRQFHLFQMKEIEHRELATHKIKQKIQTNDGE